MFLLPMKTTTELVLTTIIASKSYLLSLAIIGYQKRLFPAHEHLCLKTFAVFPQIVS